MSSGEERTVRLVATLANIRESGYQPGTDELTSYQRFIPWSVHDTGGWDDRGQAILEDWIRIVRGY